MSTFVEDSCKNSRHMFCLTVVPKWIMDGMISCKFNRNCSWLDHLCSEVAGIKIRRTARSYWAWCLEVWSSNLNLSSPTPTVQHHIGLEPPSSSQVYAWILIPGAIRPQSLRPLHTQYTASAPLSWNYRSIQECLPWIAYMPPFCPHWPCTRSKRGWRIPVPRISNDKWSCQRPLRLLQRRRWSGSQKPRWPRFDWRWQRCQWWLAGQLEQS